MLAVCVLRMDVVQAILLVLVFISSAQAGSAGLVQGEDPVEMGIVVVEAVPKCLKGVGSFGHVRLYTISFDARWDWADVPSVVMGHLTPICTTVAHCAVEGISASSCQEGERGEIKEENGCLGVEGKHDFGRIC